MSGLYNATALADAAGATYRQVEYWTNQGYLTPVDINGSPRKGSGHYRIYDEVEVVVAQSLVALTTDFRTVAASVRTALSVGAARVTPHLVLAHDEGLTS